MKIYFLLILSLFSASLNAQVYWQTDFEQAKKSTLVTGKRIVVECYHPECTHCQLLNENLNNGALAKYLNDNYTNLKIDLTKPDEVKILEEKNIRLINYPIFLFFDKEGNFEYFIEPRETPIDIIRQFELERGNSCVDCDKSQSPGTIEKVRCAVFYRLNKNYEKSNAVCDRFFKELSDTEKNQIGPWTVFKKVVYSTNNDFFKFYMNNQALAASLEGNNGKEKDVFATVISQQIKYLENKGKFPAWELDSINSYLIRMGANEKQRLAWTWSLELVHHLSNIDYFSAIALCRKMSENYPDISTFGFLSEKINEKVAGNEMYMYFSEIRQNWLAGLKDPRQKLQFYKQSALYYGKNKQKDECAEALESASKFGLSQSEKSSMLVKYCQQ
ncbi:MAG TPA: thioredoxin family protein [Leadbetterella sp.]|nr:thioredoxin family protein [Leadbetterella sp.]